MLYIYVTNAFLNAVCSVIILNNPVIHFHISVHLCKQIFLLDKVVQT